MSLHHASAGREHMFVEPFTAARSGSSGVSIPLAGQTMPSPVVMTTSTPRDHLAEIGRRRGIPLKVTPDSGGIAADWNFAMSHATSSVMISRNGMSDFRLAEGWRCGLDWQAWLDFAGPPGAFVYVREPLVRRTVHAGAATVAWLEQRAAEDERILRQLWPAPMAALIGRLYSLSRRRFVRLSLERDMGAT